MSDYLDERLEWLTGLSEAGGPLTVDAPNATINDRRYFRRIGGQPHPTATRRDVHRRILTEWAAAQPDVTRGRRAIVMAGPPGAGKTTAQAALLGADLPHWRLLDADEFKSRLLEYALADGALEKMLPARLRTPAGHPPLLQPHELSALVHHESSILLTRAVTQSLERGENVVIDGTLAWKPWADELIARLDEHDYTIAIADVEAPQHIAAARIIERWRRGYTEAHTAADSRHLGGRWLPASAVDRLFPHTREPDGLVLDGKSVSEVNAREAAEHPAVRRYDRYWTGAVDQSPRHVERSARDDTGVMRPVQLPVIPKQVADTIRAALADASPPSPPPGQSTT